MIIFNLSIFSRSRKHFYYKDMLERETDYFIVFLQMLSTNLMKGIPITVLLDSAIEVLVNKNASMAEMLCTIKGASDFN